MKHFMSLIWNEEEQHHLLLLTVAKNQNDAIKRLKESGFKKPEAFDFVKLHQIMGKDLVIETHDLQDQNFSFHKVPDLSERN